MIRIIKKIIDLIFIIIIVVLVGYLFLRYTNRVCIYKVKTGSMEDNIHVGDYVLIMHKDEYKIGDVVTFEKNDGFITHRIVKIDGDNIVTKGDANNVEDDTIDKSSIIGKVILSGGMINIIITYKYAIVAVFLSIYLFSCYFGKKQLNVEELEELKADEESEKILKNSNDDIEEKSEIDDKKEEILKDDEDSEKNIENNDNQNDIEKDNNKTYFEKIDEVEEKNKKINVKAKYNNTKKVLKKKKKD